MAEEIKIKVKQEAEGTAIKDATKEAEKLKQTQAGTGAAGTAARSERSSEESHNRKRVQAEKEVTKEKEKQSAVAKASGHGKGGVNNAQMIGDILDQVTGSQGWVFRMRGLMNMRHMLGALGPMGLAGLGVGALAMGAFGLVSHKVGEGDKEVAEQNRIRETRLSNARARARLKEFGTSGEAHSMVLGAQEKLDELKDQHFTIQDEMASGVFGHIDRALGTNFRRGILGKSEGQRRLEANEHDQATQRIQLAKAKQIEEKKFTEEGGMDEIKEQEARNQGKVKEANALKDTVIWWQRYHAAKDQGADEATAQRAAGDAVFGEQKERAGSFANVVNARTGAAGAANLARLAMVQMGLGDQSRVTGSLQAIFGQGKEAMAASDAIWREKFKPRKAHE
jgi:hypothetical protein